MRDESSVRDRLLVQRRARGCESAVLQPRRDDENGAVDAGSLSALAAAFPEEEPDDAIAEEEEAAAAPT